MNYKKQYFLLIEKANNRVLEGYAETHHIIPRCMGGSDEPDNLVELTPEEHYVAHQLLVKMYPGNHSLAMAAQMMIPNRPSNKMYGWLKRKFAEAMSESQKGEGNSQYGTRWIHNVELEESKKIDKNLPLPEGWSEGRIIDFRRYAEDKLRRQSLLKSKKEAKQRKKEQVINELSTLYERYKNGEPLQSVAEDYPSSYVSLYKKFQRYFPPVPRETGRGNKKNS